MNHMIFNGNSFSSILALFLVALLVPHPGGVKMGAEAQVLAPVAPTSPDQVPAEILELYNFLVQSGGQLIVHLGSILGNYLDTALVLSIQGISKREAESPVESLMMALKNVNNGTVNEKVLRERGLYRNEDTIQKLKEFQREIASVESELETLIGEANLLQWLGAVHTAQNGFNNIEAIMAEHHYFMKEQEDLKLKQNGEGESIHLNRKRRQTTLGNMQYGYVIATSLQTLFSYLKASLGQFTYLSSQLLNLYQILPVQPGTG